MSASLKDIAAATGVSPTAVSYVLNGRDAKVSPATREKVAAAAERMGYRPNGSARAFRQGRHGAAALIMSPGRHRSLLDPGLVQGIHRELARRHLRLLVDYVTDAQLTSAKTLPRLLAERACDGMLLNYNTRVPPGLAGLVERLRLPTVWINTRQAFNSVYPDDFGAARRATETLLAEGHRRVAYVDVTFNAAAESGDIHFSKHDRRAGYGAAMRDAGLPAEFILDADGGRAPSRRESVAASLAKLHAVFTRKRPAPPTAVVSYGGWDLAVLRQIQAMLRRGIAVMAFGLGDNQLNDQLARGLVVPLEEMGRRAVAMLLRRIENPAPVPSEIVPFRPLDTAAE